MAEVKQQIEAVLKKHPTLCFDGFGVHPIIAKEMTEDRRAEELRIKRELMLEHGEAFSLCCEWLTLCEKRKSINQDIPQSDGLRKRVERWAEREKQLRVDVPNGIFIAAAIHMGFECAPSDWNGSFNISSKSAPLGYGL